MILRLLQGGHLEAEIPGFFVRIRDRFSRQRSQAPSPGGNPRYIIGQVIKGKVLMQGSKLLVGLYIDTGSGDNQIIKVKRISIGPGLLLIGSLGEKCSLGVPCAMHSMSVLPLIQLINHHTGR